MSRVLILAVWAATLMVLAISLPARAAPPAAASCGIATTGLHFGLYDPLDPSPTDFDGIVEVTCLLEPSPSAVNFFYNVTASTGVSGQYGARTLQSGTNLLQYNLFTDVARTLVWGDGTGVSAPIGGRMQLQKNTTRITQTQSLPVRGRIPALQDAEQGQYLDVLVITLEF